jgi:hypothetical protein
MQDLQSSFSYMILMYRACYLHRSEDIAHSFAARVSCFLWKAMQLGGCLPNPIRVFLFSIPLVRSVLPQFLKQEKVYFLTDPSDRELRLSKRRQTPRRPGVVFFVLLSAKGPIQIEIDRATINSEPNYKGLVI